MKLQEITKEEPKEILILLQKFMTISNCYQQRPWGYLYRHQETYRIQSQLQDQTLHQRSKNYCGSMAKAVFPRQHLDRYASDLAGRLSLPRCTVRASRTERIFPASLQRWASLYWGLFNLLYIP